MCIYKKGCDETRGENVSKVDAGQWHKMKSGFAFY